VAGIWYWVLGINYQRSEVRAAETSGPERSEVRGQMAAKPDRRGQMTSDRREWAKDSKPRGILSGKSGSQPCNGDHAPDTQFSHLRFGILENSLMLFEIIVKSRLKA
jgi:hypothetical protein